LTNKIASRRLKNTKKKTVSYSDIVSSLRRVGRVGSSSEVLLISEAAGKIE
jgi:hypothetical protein